MKLPPTDLAFEQAELPDCQALEEQIFEFLVSKYVQEQDARQRRMGLQYMGAETHELARELARFLRCRRVH